MWLCYLDESGNTGRRLDDPDQPVHLIAAVLVPEAQVLALARAVEAVTCDELGVDVGAVELHGAQLFSGDGKWRGVPPATRVKVYERALSLLGEYDCVVAHASIDKAKLANRYERPDSPHILALQFLVEKVDAFLRQQADPLAQRALLIADETHEHEAFALALVADMQRWGSPIGPGDQVERVIDTVHFVRSETNPGVQLADLVAYALNRARRVTPHSTKPSDLALRALVDRIRPRIRTYRGTWPT